MTRFEMYILIGLGCIIAFQMFLLTWALVALTTLNTRVYSAAEQGVRSALSEYSRIQVIDEIGE